MKTLTFIFLLGFSSLVLGDSISLFNNGTLLFSPTNSASIGTNGFLSMSNTNVVLTLTTNGIAYTNFYFNLRSQP